MLCPFQHLVDRRHGFRIHPIVQTIRLQDVKHRELGCQSGGKIDRELEALFRIMTQRGGKDNPARFALWRWLEMRTHGANGNI